MQAEEQGMMGEITQPEGQASGKPFTNNQVMQQMTA